MLNGALTCAKPQRKLDPAYESPQVDEEPKTDKNRHPGEPNTVSAFTEPHSEGNQQPDNYKRVSNVYEKGRQQERKGLAQSWQSQRLPGRRDFFMDTWEVSRHYLDEEGRGEIGICGVFLVGCE